MTRYLVTIFGPRSRNEALAIVAKAPNGTRVEVKAAKRTDDQNSLMWVLLTAVALQVPVEGKKHRPEDWNDCFMAALQAALVEQDPSLAVATMPAIDGSGRRVNVGNSTSDLSKDEMSMLIELIFKFGAEHGVTFQDEGEAAA